MMNEFVILFLAGISGVSLGVIFFGGLSSTVEKGLYQIAQLAGLCVVGVRKSKASLSFT
jgi:hypothetical protein